MPLQTMPRTNTDTEVAARLRLALTRLARRLRQESEAGITPSQLSALASVASLGPLTLGELAAVERVQPPTMTRVVAALEEGGLLARTVDAGDRRVARVDLTAAGRRLLDRNRTRKDLFLAARLRRLPPADRELLARAAGVLERLAEDEQ
jgi:DNA-binding MarR family transcriptional regulator